MTIRPIQIRNFQDALSSVYLEKPCQVLPNALWKTRARLGELETKYTLQDALVSQLAIWSTKELFTFWTRSRSAVDFPFNQFSSSNLLLVHQDYISGVDLNAFTERKCYFRLRYSGATMPEVPPGWRIREAAPEDETEAVASFIRQCYPGLQVSAETIRKWENYPVHDPSLWVWVENANGQAMGLGIAEFDDRINEGSLEWIQVLPAYQRMGVGLILVATLVRRLRPQSVLITVSGKMGDSSRPDLLYRKCGFVGEDVWWVLRRLRPGSAVMS